MKDNYPTRKSDTWELLPRLEPFVHGFIPDEFFKRNGFTILKDVFHKTLIDACLKQDVEGLVTMEPLVEKVRAKTGIHNSGIVSKIAKHPILLREVRDILGEEIYIYQSRINYKYALDGSGWSWHSDFETWHAQDGMPGMRCLTAMIPLTENTECNGSLMVIPGSHRQFCSCAKEKTVSAEDNYANQKEGVPPKEAIAKFFDLNHNRIKMLTCSPGDLILFDCNLIHVSTPNLSPFDRTNLFIVYNHISNMVVDPFSAGKHRPVEMCTLNPELI